MAKDFKVILDEGTERAATFEKVFGRREVCVQSPIPALANLPGFDAPQRVYLLDLNELRGDELERMILHLAERFDISPNEVRRLLAERGVPILASECSVVVENPQRWLD